ncbi:xanthine dehydrogenase family protein subunit M [uncultured Deinococcus sp.]|uniref:FAD binding domain-containing protein n=1 Tax=uncultured Deinococcus sp. TaxID=158789 RepID=UPI0025F07F4F|nr:xanthine dehydrogenase family protein subunit M [uncultured Deinococcus sp.]
MFPAAFEYVRAHSAEEALSLLAQHGSDARILAGGQSLIPAMRYRLARPTVLVDIGPLRELKYLRDDGPGGFLRVGAMTADMTLERDQHVRARYSLLTDTSDVVADPVVRCVGTVVGSLCHNDPSGDWGAAALAARAVMVVRGKDGEREIPIDEWLVDSFQTALEEGEMAVEVRFPTPDARTQGAYQKIERKVGDYATAAAAVQLTVDDSGRVTHAGVALTAAGPRPVRVDAAERILVGQTLSENLIRAASDEARAISEPFADTRGGVDYKKDMARVLVARGLRKAAGRLNLDLGATA